MNYDPEAYWNKRAFRYLRFEPLRVARELLLSPLRIRMVDQEIRRLKPRSLLEVGCGPGRMLPLYARTPDVHCVDFSQAMLRRARARAESKGWSHMHFARMPAQELDFPDQRFDLVMSSVVLLHIPPESIQAAVEEMVRVSARWVMVAEYSQVDVEALGRRPTRAHVFAHDFRELFSRAGARLEHVRQVPFRPQELLLFSR